MFRLATYGTFREGECRAHFLEEVRKRGHSEIVELVGAKMFDLGPYPGVRLTGDKKDKIIAEVIEADLNHKEEKELLESLDLIEGVAAGLYKQGEIDTPMGKALIYVYCLEVAESDKVIVDWVKGE